MLTHEELLELLGDELLGDGRGITPENRDRKRRFAAQWLERWLDERRTAICSDARVVAITSHAGTQTNLEELAVLLDVLSPMLGVPPLVTVSVIIVKRGLSRLCAD